MVVKKFTKFGLNSDRKHDVIKVDPKCSLSLEILYSNSKRSTGPTLSCLDPDYWWDDIFDEFYENVSYVARSKNVEMHNFSTSDYPKDFYYDRVVKNYECDELEFTSIDELKSWLLKNRLNNIALNSMTKLVDMKNLKELYTISYAFISDTQESRNSKLQHIMEDESNWEDDLPF